MTKKLVAKADHDIEIVGTYERLFGRSNIIGARPGADGEFDLDYNGTEIFWDDAKTVRRNGERVFLDEDGQTYLESEIELIDVAEEEDEREPANEQAYYKALLDLPADDTPCACSNCGTLWRYGQLKAIGECVLTPGDPSPAGRCADPKCDSLAYVDPTDEEGSHYTFCEPT